MAPTDTPIETQTSLIVSCLLEDETEPEQVSSCIVPDGPGSDGEDDSFDPAVIASQLRRVADKLNNDVTLKAVVNNLLKAAAKEALEEEFGRGVDTLCKAQAAQTAEVAPELQMIRASVALGLYMKKQWPELRTKVQGAMTAFLNRRVSCWVAEQGGWDRVARV
ncbi:bcl-2-like protein 15 [Genypterus blacodes]|uniref:bcl-2-like protein 15 n=1 Tax=Genypterus blacodes TaxID=154954 RepID=UPI003F75FE65